MENAASMASAANAAMMRADGANAAASIYSTFSTEPEPLGPHHLDIADRDDARIHAEEGFDPGERRLARPRDHPARRSRIICE
jgi:hypothetical protein